jgi:hypothetical protein
MTESVPFTRERSKVRSLVRPPPKPRKSGLFAFLERAVRPLSQIQTGFRPLARHNAKDRPEGSLFAVIGEIRLREVLKPDGVGDTP